MINYCGAQDLVVGCSLEQFVEFVNSVNIPMKQFWPLCKTDEEAARARQAVVWMTIVCVLFLGLFWMYKFYKRDTKAQILKKLMEDGQKVQEQKVFREIDQMNAEYFIFLT
jgi:amino acid permease